jgi:hypothetical protein
MKVLISLIACASLITSNAMAITQSLSTKIYSNYSSIRALGMGNAFTAVADDYSLIMYNPAGFARKKHNEIQLSLLGAGYSPKTLTLANDIQKASDAGGTDSQKAQNISDVLEKYYGQSLGGKVQALELFWIRKNWGFAFLPADLTVDMSINRQVGPAIDLNVKGDTTFALGYGTDLNKYVDMGITAKYVHRVSIEQIVPAFELATDSNVLSTKRMKEGTTADFDLGFMWTPGWFNSSKKEVAPVKSETITPPPVVEAIQPTEPVKSEDLKPQEPKKDEVVGADEKPVDAPVAEKPADAVAEEPKADAPPPAAADEPQVEETRAPQAEGEATEVKVAEEPPATPEEEAAAKAAADAKAAQEAEQAKATQEANDIDAALQNKPVPPVIPPGKKPDEPVKIEEIKKEEVAKPEENKVEPKKIEDVASVEELEERYPLSFAAVIHNVIGGEFTLSKMVNKDATEVPTKMYRVLDLGSQYKLYNGEDLVIRYMLDFKDIGHPEITFNKSFHTGLEFDYSPSTWFKTQFRAGVNQMYYTAGVTFLFGFLNFDVATYGEEVGTVDTKAENRVYAAKVSMNF